MIPRVTTRRRFLAALATAAAACRVDSPSAASPASSPNPSTAPSADTIAAAERVLGVRYTQSEREMIADTLQEQLGFVASRRGHPLPNQLAPATVFDPRPPGFATPTHATAPVLPTIARSVPTDDEELAFASVAELSHWLGSGQVTSRRLTELSLARLARLGPGLECVITPCEQRALAQADAADKALAAGRRRGPLHGIPWGAKDLFDTKDIATTWGAAPYRDRVPSTNASVVQRLDDAGAVLVAKLSLGALAYGDLWFGGQTRNPWNPAEGSSGSSAGSAAAVAAGLVGFALGTETLGSIVSPCMRCGTTGLRPTFGRVSRTGAMALCWSMDKVGPIARSVEDCALVLHAINGADAGDPSSLDVPLELDLSRPLDGITVGIIPGWFSGDDLTEPERALPKALRDAGMKVRELPSLPDLPYAAMLTILYAEAAAAFEALTLDDRDDELVWQQPQAWPNGFRRARLLSAIDLVQAQRVRREVMNAMAERFADVDVLAGPSFAGGMLLATNMTGHPSLTLRAGFVDRGPIDSLSSEALAGEPRPMPQGVTLWGRLFDEGTLCRAGMALQQHLGVASRRPPSA
ncbi:MAG: amidase [Deltaproteobacteria bacterium]|nr:amidase [Deltaproteobacteria bacterium]